MNKIIHSRNLVLPIMAMALVVLISNILVQFLLGNFLTWGALTYPIAFLITDLTNRFYGKGAARKVVMYGFIIGVFCSFLGTQMDGDFGPLVTLRIAIGSALAFLVSVVRLGFLSADWYNCEGVLIPPSLKIHT